MQQDADLTPELVEEVASRGGLFVTKIPIHPKAMDMFWDRFSCRRCGVCCSGDCVGRTENDGVAIIPSEMERLASYLLMSPRAFKKKHTFHTGHIRVMRYPCPFYIQEGKICSVYKNRPMVCITFPINQGGWTWIEGVKIWLLTISLNCAAAKEAALEFIKVEITKENLVRALNWQARFQEKFGEMG